MSQTSPVGYALNTLQVEFQGDLQLLEIIQYLISSVAI